MSKIRVNEIESLDGKGEGLFSYPYEAGLEITSHNTIVRDGDIEYRLSKGTELPYTTTGNGMPEGGAFAVAGGGVVAVGSIADLLALPVGQRQEGLRYLVKGYHPETDTGGGEFYWDPSLPKSEADGGAVLDPSIAFGDDFTEFLSAQGSTTGVGCFVRLVGASVSVSEYGAIPSESESSHTAIQRCVDFCTRNSKKMIIPDGEFFVSEAISVRSAIDIDCHGVIVSDASTNSRIFEFRPPSESDIVLDPHSISGLHVGSAQLEYAGDLPSDLHNYYILIDSTELLPPRIGSDRYSPYNKIEAHDILTNTFVLSDSIILDYEDMDALTVTLVRKQVHSVVNGLRLRAKNETSSTSEDLLRLWKFSNVTFNGLDVRGSRQGIHIYYSANITFNDLTALIHGVSGQDTYTLLGMYSYGLTFNRYVAATDSENTSASYSGRQSNFVRFNECVLLGSGCHYGYNFSYDKCQIFGRIYHAGHNLSISNTDVKGRSILTCRHDFLMNSGHLSITNCTLDIDPGNFSAIVEMVAPYAHEAFEGEGVEEDGCHLKFWDTIDICGVKVTDRNASGTLINIRSSSWMEDYYRDRSWDLFHIHETRSLNIRDVVFESTKVGSVRVIPMTIDIKCPNITVDNVKLSTLDSNGHQVDAQELRVLTAPFEVQAGQPYTADVVTKINQMFGFGGDVVPKITISNIFSPVSLLLGYKSVIEVINSTVGYMRFDRAVENSEIRFESCKFIVRPLVNTTPPAADLPGFVLNMPMVLQNCELDFNGVLIGGNSGLTYDKMIGNVATNSVDLGVWSVNDINYYVNPNKYITPSP